MNYEYASGTSLFGSKYRTSVVNDFSIVTKAVFYITEEIPEDRLGNYESYTIKECLPVQINPSKFSGSYGTHKRKTWGQSITGGDPSERKRKHMKMYDCDDETVSIGLHYDIYDEYMIRTMDGMIPVEDMTLMSPTATSLKKLQNYAGEDEFRTIFKWGDIEYLGFMNKIDYEYTCFSRWGQPLKAEATVHMYVDSLGKNEKTYERKSPLKCLSADTSAKIKSYTKNEEIEGRIALGLTASLR